MGSGTMFEAFLTEIASHGFMVLANSERFPQTTAAMTGTLDWAEKAGGEYAGNLDTGLRRAGGREI